MMAGMAMTPTAVYMKVQEGYVAFIEELPGANTQGETLDEARENLNEAVALVLEANRVLVEQSLEGATVIRETFVLSAA
jgi:predicted RNase H-like HicB family nuclease